MRTTQQCLYSSCICEEDMTMFTYQFLQVNFPSSSETDINLLNFVDLPVLQAGNLIGSPIRLVLSVSLSYQFPKNVQDSQLMKYCRSLFFEFEETNSDILLMRSTSRNIILPSFVCLSYFLGVFFVCLSLSVKYATNQIITYIAFVPL